MNLRKLDILITHANPKRSIMLKGVHGLGKTQWVKQLAKRLGLKFVIWHASHAADAGDITGLPKQIKETVIWVDKDGVWNGVYEPEDKIGDHKVVK
jgi:MoxR-like ATPase